MGTQVHGVPPCLKIYPGAENRGELGLGLGCPFVFAGMAFSGVEIRKWGDKGPGCPMERVPYKSIPIPTSWCELNELSIWQKKRSSGTVMAWHSL